MKADTAMTSEDADGVSQPRRVRDYFEDDGTPIKCPKCDSTKITEKITGMVDVFQGMGPTCEAEYFCECGECVGFWAYGFWHSQHRDSFLANNLGCNTGRGLPAKENKH